MRIKHPEVGMIDVEYEALQVHGDQEQKLVLYAAAEGSPSAEALNLLASWTARPRGINGGSLRATDTAGVTERQEEHRI
jgi:hypothetical protein